MGTHFLVESVAIGQQVMVLNKERVDLDEIKGRNFLQRGSETLAHVAQRCDRCPIPGNIQGQTGWGSE